MNVNSQLVAPVATVALVLLCGCATTGTLKSNAQSNSPSARSAVKVETEGRVVRGADASGTRTALLLDRAKHLTRSGDLGEASRLLSLLLEQAVGPTRLRARAMLGVIRIQQGRLQEAQGLLSTVVADPAAEGWPGRTEALADLGLAHLLAGDEAEGLRCLRDAQQAFEAAGDESQAARCKRNEARYFESATGSAAPLSATELRSHEDIAR
jgi:hypothetical protein